MQKALEEGRLMFGDKSNKPTQIDADPLKQANSMYVKIVDVNVIEAAESAAESFGKPKKTNNYQKNEVEMVTENHICNNEMVTEDQYAEKMKIAYPTSEEDLVDFLKRCKISNSKPMLCPRCSVIFDKEPARSIEGFKPQSKRKGKWVDKKPKFDFNRSDLTYKASTQRTFSRKSKMKTFTPPSKSPTEKWVFSGGRKSNYNAPPTKWVKRVTCTNAHKKTCDSKKFAYNNNYKGKNPMTKT